jgi:hypothetical protein
MNKQEEYLLSLGHCWISLSAIKEMKMFYKKREIKGLRGLGLVLSGHSPFDGLDFCIDKFKTWCRDNFINYEIDEYNQVVGLSPEINADLKRKSKPKN